VRCYNGQPDDELKAVLDADEKAGEELAAKGLRATYFPVEQAWMVFDARHLPVTDFYPTKRSAANAALRLAGEGPQKA
jgi:hypothetical protein